LVLLVFCFASLLNNVICFTFAPISHLSASLYKDSQWFPKMARVGFLIQIFLVTYALTSFPTGLICRRIGLRKALLFGCGLQLVGCFLRAISWNNYNVVLAGQILASLAQAVLVNTPSEISLLWFGEKERSFSTSMAVNSNSLGIAVIYTIAPSVVTSEEKIQTLLWLIVLVCATSTVLVFIFFEGCPPKPPTKSAELRMLHIAQLNDCTTVKVPFTRELLGDMRSVGCLVKKNGFLRLVTGFSVSEALINSFSSQMNVILVYRKVPHLSVRWIGSGFILASMFGSAFIGWALDRTKNYKGALIFTLLMTLASCVVFPFVPTQTFLVLSILSIGFWIGPVQTVTIEGAAEVVFPMSESLATAVMQVSGNFLSVAFLPLVGFYATSDYLGWLLSATVGCVLIMSTRFDGRYERLVFEQAWPSCSETGTGNTPLILDSVMSGSARRWEASITDTGTSSDIETETTS